jgi:hypothetical protein
VDKPIKHIFVFTPSVGVKHFELDETMFLRTSSVEAAHICGVYMILIFGA